MRAFIASLTLCFALLGAVSLHASATQNPAARAKRQSLALQLRWADLALSSDARWLRHPSQSEPAAALSDAPGALDLDPAGGLIAPPRALWNPSARIEAR